MNNYLQMKQSNEKKTELRIDTIKVFNAKTKYINMYN